VNRRFEPAVASLVTGAALLVLFLDTTRLPPELPLFREPLDHQKYIAMASSDPFSMRIAPFCRRVLNLRWAWKFAPLIALAAVTSRFGNVERLLVVAFSALIVMAAEGARSIDKPSSR
jgi:hypothetical protein